MSRKNGETDRKKQDAASLLFSSPALLPPVSFSVRVFFAFGG